MGVQGGPGERPGAPCGRVGASWARLGAVVWRLRDFRGPSLAVSGVLRRLGAVPGRLGEHLGASLSVLGASGSELCPRMGRGGAIRLGPSRDLVLGLSGLGLGSQARAKPAVEGVLRRGAAILSKFFYSERKGQGTPNVLYDARWWTSLCCQVMHERSLFRWIVLFPRSSALLRGGDWQLTSFRFELLTASNRHQMA